MATSIIAGVLWDAIGPKSTFLFTVLAKAALLIVPGHHHSVNHDAAFSWASLLRAKIADDNFCFIEFLLHMFIFQ